jgi:ankyrin repeat protein
MPVNGRFRLNFWLAILLASLLSWFSGGCNSSSPSDQFKFSSTDSSEPAALETTQKFLMRGGCAGVISDDPQEALFGRTRLHVAARLGWPQVAELLLRNGADTDPLDIDKETPLLTAVIEGHSDVAQLLIEHGANVRAVNKYGNSPLVYAARKCMTSTVALLLDHGADPNEGARDGGEGTPIYEAAGSGDIETIELLIARGARLQGNVTEGMVFTSRALRAAAGTGHLEAAQVMIKHGAVPDLITAAGIGDVSALRSELSVGSDWAKDMANQAEFGIRPGMTPLIMAASNNQIEAAKILLDAGADVNAPSGWYAPPLCIAAEKGYVEMARLLIERGANVEGNSTGIHSKGTPLQEAALAGQAEVATLLLDHGAKVDSTDRNGQSPLFHAAYKGYMSVVQVLVEHGADVHARTVSGWTVLHVVGREYQAVGTDAARFLIEHGAEVNVRDERGETPLDRQSDDHMRALLRQHGGKKGAELDAEAGIPPKNPPPATTKKGK